MKFRQIILAGVLAGAAMWIVAGIFHEITAVTYYQAAADLDRGGHQGMGLILGVYLVLGLMMAGLYAQLRFDPRKLANGLLFGTFIGVLWVLPIGLVDAAAHGAPLAHEFVNGAWHMAEQGLGGLLIATIARFRGRAAMV